VRFILFKSMAIWNNMITMYLYITAIQQDNEVLVLVERGR